MNDQIGREVAQCPDEYEAVMWGPREESLAEREG